MTTAAAGRRSALAGGQTLTITLLVAGYSGYYLCRSNLSVTMPLIISELGRRGVDANVARVQFGTIASLGVLAYAIGKFPSGSLADYLGGRRNFLAGMAGSILCTLLFAASGALPLFTLAWMGNRLAQSLGWAGMVKIVSRWFPFQRYGTVMSVISLSYLFGDAVSRQFMAMLIAAGFGWRGVFAAGAAVLGLLLVTCIWLLRESPAQMGEAEPSANPECLFQGQDAAGGGLKVLLGAFFGSSVFWLACALSFGITILRETFALWTPTYFTQAAGMNAAQAASSSALFPLFGGVSVILCGWLSDRWGHGGGAAVLFYGLLLASVVLLALSGGAAQGSQLLPVVFVGLVAFLIVGPYSLLAGAISLDFGGKRASGTASGLIDGVGYLGGVLSGDTVARISVGYGWNRAFLVLAIISFISSLTAAAYLRHGKTSAR